MKSLILLIALSLSFNLCAADPAPAAALNTVCPVSGKPVDPRITCVYEARTYAFADEASRTKFEEARAASLYQQIGGQPAMDAAVDLFYTKVLADERVKHFFDDINMNKQKRMQKQFLSAALGSPVKYEGRDMRSAHSSLTGLNDTHFDAIGGHLKATLEELKVNPESIAKILAIVETTRSHVLNRPEGTK